MIRYVPSKGLGGIKAQSKPLFSLPSWTNETYWMIEDIFYGSAAGIAPFFISPPFCKDAEVKLALGLGLTGLAWAFTGRNYLAISGAIVSLGAYAICKTSPTFLDVKVRGVVPPPR